MSSARNMRKLFISWSLLLHLLLTSAGANGAREFNGKNLEELMIGNGKHNLFWLPIMDNSNTHNLFWSPSVDDSNTHNLFWSPSVDDNHNLFWLPSVDDNDNHSLFWLPSVDDNDKHNLFWLPSVDISNKHNFFWVASMDASNERNLGLPINIDDGNKGNHNHYMDPKFALFFLKKDLKLGKRIPIYFPNINSSTSPHILTREEAESIPFSYQEFPRILQLFSIHEGSAQARLMEITLKVCQAKQLKGEIKLCPTSLESMFDFVRGILGPQFQTLSTNYLTQSKVTSQNYTIIGEPQKVTAPKLVACHVLPYPYVVLYCHTPTGGRPFKVSVMGDNGDRTEAMVVCHGNTSEWSPNHIAFRLLGTKPGAEVCHFLSADNLLFVPM